MAEDAFSGGSAKTPAPALVRLGHVDLVTGGEHVGVAWQMFDALFDAGGIRPRNLLRAQIKTGVLVNVTDIWIRAVARPAAGLKFHGVAQQ